MSTNGRRYLTAIGSQLALNILVITVMMALAVGGTFFGLPPGVCLGLLVVGLLVAVAWLAIASAAGEQIGGGIGKVVAVALVVAALASIAAGAVSYSAAESLVLEQRGRWTKAVVTEYSPARPNPGRGPATFDPLCYLETAEGERIRPHLKQSRGCVGLHTGARVDVIYDPRGQIRPRTDDPPSYTSTVAGLAAVGAGAGTLSSTVLALLTGSQRWWSSSARRSAGRARR